MHPPPEAYMVHGGDVGPGGEKQGYGMFVPFPADLPERFGGKKAVFGTPPGSYMVLGSDVGLGGE